jgi:hypothetical protein
MSDRLNDKWCYFRLPGLFCFLVLTGFLFCNPRLAHPGAADAQVANSPSTIPGLTLTVTNTSDDLNGEYWSPEDLIANPGPDGISFAEALKAVEADTGAHEIIQFDPSLSGSVIFVTEHLTSIWRDGLTLDGDIDDDGVPDITIDGSNHLGSNGLILAGASQVVIEGLALRNFEGTGILIVNNIEQGITIFGDLVLRNNIISNTTGEGIMVNLKEQDHAAIRNVEIVGNTLQDNLNGVGINAGADVGATDNEISNVSIISNTIINPGPHIAVTIRAELYRNTVSDVEIRGNHISGHTNTSILVDAANCLNCQDNTISDLVIADNWIDGTPVTIEIVSVGQDGQSATGNQVCDVTITDNVLTGGGIQFGGATGWNASNNTISGVLVDRNHISSCANNGIFLIAGDGGAHDNLLESVVLRNTFVGDCTDTGLLLHGKNVLSPNNTISGVTIANLTLVDNGIGSGWAGGLNINSQDSSNIISGVTVSNTILWGNNFGDVILGSVAPDSVAYSVLNDGRFVGSDGNLYQSPQFVDPASGDYHLQPGSPCVDTGDPSAWHVGPQDLDNRVRLWDGDDDALAVVDRGAWEYASTLAQEIDLQGNGLSILNGDTMPAPWDGTDFGIAAVPEGTVEQIYTIRNSGGLSLTLTADPRVEITGTHAADFVVTTQPQSPIAAGGSTSFTVTFDPGAEGLRSAAIRIGNDDSDENPYGFSVQGTGGFPEIDVQGNDLSIADGDVEPSAGDHTDFGTAAVLGGSVEWTYTIENTGIAPLTLTGAPKVAISGTHAADFAVTIQPQSPIAARAWTTFTVTFRPSAGGLRSAAIRIDNDDLDETPYDFSIQGTGAFTVYLPLLLR